jgi:DNA-binding CsgD family transcriptional regulator/PAS domain-containing protein
MLATALLIELAYSAVDDPARWHNFLEAFCRATNADAATLAILHPDHRDWDVSCYFGLSKEDIDRYPKNWGHWGLRANGYANQEKVLNVPVGEVVPSHLACPDEVFERLDVYREFFARCNLHYGASMTITANHLQRSVLTTLKAKSRGPVEEPEIRIWAALGPYLQEVMALHAEQAALQSKREALIDYADDPTRAMFLVNEGGFILHANQAAERLLLTSILIRREEGRLRLTPDTAQNRLLKALQTVAGTNGKGHLHTASFPFDNRNGHPMLATVKSIGNYKSTVGGPSLAAVHIIDPRLPQQIDLENLAALFEFTQAEAWLAARLANGRTLHEAAAEAGVSMNTIRTHLKHALEKSGCHRQAELVALVIRSQQ